MTILDTRILLDDFFRVDEATLEVDGVEQRRLVLDRGDSVAAIVFRRDDATVLLTRQFRYPTFREGPGWVVEVVAGMVEPEEAPDVSLRRELEEELGYGADVVEPIATFYVSPGGSNERIHLYYVEVDAADRVGDGGGLSSEGEDIEVLAYSLEELAQARARHDFVDAKTIIAVDWLLDRRARARA